MPQIDINWIEKKNPIYISFKVAGRAGQMPPRHQQLQQQQQQQQPQYGAMYDDFEPENLSPVRQEGPAFTSPQPDPYPAYPTNYYGQQPFHAQLAGYKNLHQPQQQQQQQQQQQHQQQQQMQQPYNPYQMQPGTISNKFQIVLWQCWENKIKLFPHFLIFIQQLPTRNS